MKAVTTRDFIQLMFGYMIIELSSLLQSNLGCREFTWENCVRKHVAFWSIGARLITLRFVSRIPDIIEISPYTISDDRICSFETIPVLSHDYRILTIFFNPLVLRLSKSLLPPIIIITHS